MTKQIKQRIKMINRDEVTEGYKKTKVGIVLMDWKEIFVFNDVEFLVTSQWY